MGQDFRTRRGYAQHVFTAGAAGVGPVRAWLDHQHHVFLNQRRLVGNQPGPFMYGSCDAMSLVVGVAEPCSQHVGAQLPVEGSH